MPANIRPKELIRQRNRRLQGLGLSLLVAGLALFGYGWTQNRGWVGTDDAFVAGHLITVEAQTEGTVVEILAENTQPVQKGDLLVRLDGAHAQIALQQAEAELGETVRALVNLTAKVESLKQRIVGKQAALTQVRHDLARFRAAAGDGAASAQQVQNAEDRLRELEATVREAEAEKAGIEAQVLGAAIADHPAVAKAKSRVRAAFLDYRRRHIVAPASGIIAKRKVQIGDSVKAGAPLLAIVPLDQLWIDANFLESQIADIRPGQPAEIGVDAYGGKPSYHGTVQGIAPGTGSTFALLPTDNATGNFIHITERVQVRIGLDPRELKDHPLRPGLSAYTRIHISEPGLPLSASSARADGEAYRTGIYEHELDGVEERIQKIIAGNQQ